MTSDGTTFDDVLANIHLQSEEAIQEVTEELHENRKLSELEELLKRIETMIRDPAVGQERKDVLHHCVGGIKCAIRMVKKMAAKHAALLPPQGDPTLPLYVGMAPNSRAIKTIYFTDKIQIWNDEMVVNQLPDEKFTLLEGAAAALRNKYDDGKVEINVSKLEALVKASGGDGRWAQRVAIWVNGMNETTAIANDCPEMLLQQGFYPPISLLFYSFSPERYAADTYVNSAHTVYLLPEGDITEDSFVNRPQKSLVIKTEAGIRVTTTQYLLAMLELKQSRVQHAGDMGKCVLETVMSLLAINASDGTFIPFVVGSKTVASLYVVYFDQQIPAVSLVKQVNMEERDQVVEMVTLLAILLEPLVKANRNKAFTWEHNQLANYTNLLSTTKRDKEMSGQSRSSRNASAPNQEMSQRQTNNKRKAATIASFQGLVTNLRFPWPRIPDLFSSPSDDEVQQEGYQQVSPFYFVGLYQDLEVFCKVWREGDDKTNRAFIEQEMELLAAANKLGVPSPQLINQLTALDLPSESSESQMDSDKYHVLTMEKLVTNYVARSDLLEYAIGLIHAVRLLHGAHILHCDIKPNNVAWDRDKRVVYLLDFGHAQWESEAKSYLATRGFEAPELLTKQPHSRATDAFSVGMTLNHVLESIRSTTMPDRVICLIKDVAQSLVDQSPEKRDLEEAASKLSGTSESWSSSEGSPPQKRSRGQDHNKPVR